jgi:hypothetical protein
MTNGLSVTNDNCLYLHTLFQDAVPLVRLVKKTIYQQHLPMPDTQCLTWTARIKI